MERKIMTWGKVDDNLAFHPKVIVAGNEAMGLWVRALSWSAQQLTDGVIPEAIIEALDGETAAEALVSAGLWHRLGDDYEFNDWIDYQPSREQVLAEREATRERSRAARAKAAAARGAKDAPQAAHSPAEPSSRRPSRIPADFSITPEMLKWADTELPYFDTRRETLVFVDYWSGKATNATKLDWVATWRNWMRKAFNDSSVSKLGNEIAPEVKHKIDVERIERLEKQQKEREQREQERKRAVPPPKCEHGKAQVNCAICLKKIATEVTP